MKRWRNALLALGVLGLVLAGAGVARLLLWGPKVGPVPNKVQGRVAGQSLATPGVGIGKDQPLRLPLSIRARIGLEEVSAEVRAIAEVVTVNGMIASHPDQTVAISSRIEGKVLEAWGLPGDLVEKGDKLVEIRSLELDSLQTSLIQAWNRLGLATTDRDLARELAARKAVAYKDLLKKEVEQRQAAREVDGLEARLRLIGLADAEIEQIRTVSLMSPVLTLRAPIGGVIVERSLVIGESVKPEQILFRLADLRRVLAEGEAFESHLPLLRRGLPVRLTVSAFPGRRFEGRIVGIGVAVDLEKRTVRFSVDVKNPPDMPLRPNMFAQMTVVVREQSNVLAIPLAAIISEGGEEVAFVAAADGYERRPLSLGHRDDRFVEVRDGLTRGERVVTTGKGQLEALYRRGIAGGPGAQTRGGAETDID